MSNFFFYWSSGTPMCYARYITLATCRYHHPGSRIYLYESTFGEDEWGFKMQDFQSKYKITTYYQQAIDKLGVIAKEYKPDDKRVLDMPPPQISDIFSCDLPTQEGGWYLDMDQLVVRNIEGIEGDWDWIGSGDLLNYIGIWYGRKGCQVLRQWRDTMLGNYSTSDYNSTGINALVKAFFTNGEWMDKFNRGEFGKCWIPNKQMFYPLMVHEGNRFWDENQFNISGAQTACVHFYGGNTKSQIMFKRLTPEYAMDGSHNDCMSRYIRDCVAKDKSSRGMFCLD